MAPGMLDQMLDQRRGHARAAMLGPHIDLDHPAPVPLLGALIAQEGIDAAQRPVGQEGSEHGQRVQRLPDFGIRLLREGFGGRDEGLGMVCQCLMPDGTIFGDISEAQASDRMGHGDHSSMVSTVTLPLV